MSVNHSMLGYSIPVFLTAIFVLSCSLVDPSPSLSEHLRDKKYSVGFNDRHWKNLGNHRADVAFYNLQSRSILAANSYCSGHEKEEVEELSINVLSIPGTKMLKGQVVKHVPKVFKDSASIYKVVEVMFQDRILFLRILTVKRDSCVYDFFHLSSSRASAKNEISAYHRFLDSIML